MYLSPFQVLRLLKERFQQNRPDIRSTNASTGKAPK
jgi:hypothetical protein